MAERFNGPNLPTRVFRRLWGWTHRFDATGTKRDRAAQLLFTVCASVAVLAGLDWLTSSGLYANLFFPVLETTPQVRAWSARVYAAIFTVGLPVAFLLWHWRDRNMRDQIENARKDVNLKEFQEVQLRAAGALDEKLPAEAREQLQIAALHQLRAFLRGDFGRDFRRPAFELLLAGHAAAEARIGLREAIERWRKGAPAPRLFRHELEKARAAASERRSAVDWERAGIIRDEWKSVFLAGFPLNGRLLDGIALPPLALLARLDLSGSSFTGAVLREAHLEGAGLRGAHLEGAVLPFAHLEGADLRQAHLEGADLSGAHLEGSSLGRASFDNKTILLADWDNCSPEVRAAAQQKLRDRGARHVDDP